MEVLLLPSASVGTTIEIRGSSFKGFEGDVYFFFERADGKKVRLPGMVSEQITGDAAGAQTAKVVIKEPCQPGQTMYGDYSGIPYQCDYVQLTPGIYKVSTETWGNKSNTLQFTVVGSNSQPSVTVLYPNMGEMLNNGGRDNIATVRWTTSNFGSMNVTVGLFNKNGDWIKTIASDILNTGSYNWKMDPTIASGEYKIAVTSPQSMANAATGPVASDLSDGTFVISTRSITPGKTFVTLVSPNGGESLATGSKIIIKWSSLGEKPTSATISLRSNARCPYGYSCTPLPNSFSNIAEISGSNLDKGEYEWTVDKLNVDDHGNGYLIGVLISKDSLGNASYDDSDSSFIIN